MRPTRSVPLDALLLDAQQRQTLTTARVLQRAGRRVGVAASADEWPTAPAMHSRSASVRCVLPDPTDGPLFADALISALRTRPTRVVIPAHDGTIEAIRARRPDIERHAAVALASELALAIATSKTRTMALANDLGLLTPRSIEVRSAGLGQSAIREIGLPAVIKPVRSWAERGGVGTRVTSVLARTLTEAERAVDWITSTGGEVIVQQWLSGRRDAVTIFVAGGQVRARFAQTSYREFPAVGGISVLCESLALDDEIVAFAQRLVDAIGLEGPSMVEFRRDQQGRPVLMEVNPRMGGSVALAVRCGVDLPGLTFAWAAGEPLEAVRAYRIGRRARWLGSDLWNMKASFDLPPGPDVPGRSQAVARFALDFVRRPAALEPFDVRDPMPAFVDLTANVFRPVRRRLRKVIGSTGHSLHRRFASS